MVNELLHGSRLLSTTINHAIGLGSPCLARREQSLDSVEQSITIFFPKTLDCYSAFKSLNDKNKCITVEEINLYWRILSESS